MASHELTTDRAFAAVPWPRAIAAALAAAGGLVLLAVLFLSLVGCASAPLAEHPGVVIERLFVPPQPPAPARWMVAIETANRLSVLEVDAASWADLPVGTRVVLIGRRTAAGWSGPVQIQRGERATKPTPQRSAA